MAITPEDAGRITQEEVSSIKEAEKKIDAVLQARYQGSGSVRITDPIASLTERCRRELLARFRKAGWSVEKKHESGDFRDPRERSYDYWVFKAGLRETSHSSLGDQIAAIEAGCVIPR